MKKIDPKISEYYRNLAKKSVEARHKKILALDKKEKNKPDKKISTD